MEAPRKIVQNDMNLCPWKNGYPQPLKSLSIFYNQLLSPIIFPGEPGEPSEP